MELLKVRFEAVALARNSCKMLLNLIGQGVPDPVYGEDARKDMDRERDLTKGDTENLLAQKLPLLSSRLIEQLKYCAFIPIKV